MSRSSATDIGVDINEYILIYFRYGFTHLSTGDLLREEVASGSELGQKLNQVMKSGQLVSNEQVLALLKNAIDKKSSGSNGFLIDGYPRQVDQAIQFEKDVSPCSVILYFDCTDQVMVERLLSRGKTSGRVDDNEETIKQRLATFHTHTQPILDHYGAKVVRLSAERDPDVIFKDVEQTLDSVIAKS